MVWHGMASPRCCLFVFVFETPHVASLRCCCLFLRLKRQSVFVFGGVSKQIFNHLGTQNTEHRTRTTEHGTRTPEHGTHEPEYRKQRSSWALIRHRLFYFRKILNLFPSTHTITKLSER
jgi:hypothetical protein